MRRCAGQLRGGASSGGGAWGGQLRGGAGAGGGAWGGFRLPGKRVLWVPKPSPGLCNPMDCSPPGSSVHGILQARILGCVAVSSLGSSRFLSLPQALQIRRGQQLAWWPTA